MTPCACGSRLAGPHCCALDENALRPTRPTEAARRRLDQAQAAYRTGNTDAVLAICGALLTEQPTLVPALMLMTLGHSKRGADETAGVLNARLGRLLAGSPASLIELVDAMIANKAWSEAMPHARNAVRVAPGNAEAHRALGVVLTAEQQPKEGEHHLRRAIELAGASPRLMLNLAETLKQQGNLAEAERLLRDVLQQAPTLTRALVVLSEIEEERGRIDAAEALLARAEALEPGHPAFRRIRAVLAERRGDDALVVELLTPHGLSAPLTQAELLLKGHALGRLGRHDDAFAAFEARSRMLRADGVVYRPEATETTRRDCKRFFRGPVLRALPRAGVRTDGPQPIFVMGLPRSGTTMVEQSLSMHRRITAAGELRALPRLAANAAALLQSPLAYPDCLSDVWLADRLHGLDLLRDTYLREASPYIEPKRGAAWFTDKMLFNQLHLGLIGLVFPHAPVLHIVRHPLDVVLSVFSHELALHVGYAASLEAAARHYHLHMDMMQHYLAEMPELRFLQVRYEDIVDAQQMATRRMLDFIGVPFERACLRFHENKRPALTLSARQVTERLNAKGRYRYRGYIRHLAPVIPILRPWIERFGYAIEGEWDDGADEAGELCLAGAAAS